MKTDYDEFKNGYVKMFTVEGYFLGMLKDITLNSIILNPFVKESFDKNPKGEYILAKENFVYSRSLVRGMHPYSKKSIESVMLKENKNKDSKEQKKEE